MPVPQPIAFGPVHIIVGLVLLALGVLLGIWIRKQAEKKAELTIADAEQKALQIENDAHKRAESKSKEMLLEAKEEIMRVRNEAEKENKERRADLQKQERRLQQKEENIDKKTETLEKKEEALNQKHAAIDKENEEIKIIKRSQTEMLERISGFTAEEAKKFLIEQVESEVTHETALKIKELEQRARDEADARAREIVATAIQRCAADHAAEITVSVVPLPNDEMKGRIIGREGRNIRTIETMTGVDLIIDDTPEAITVSCFEPVRREVARIALEKLIADGRIHPTHIEEMVAKARREVDAVIKSEGERAVLETGVRGVNPELVKMLGRLHYRTSYGQNVLQHSIEVSHLSGMIAAELGADVTAAKRAGLLHDIGKSVDHEMEGTHVSLGVEFMRKYHEKDEIIHAVQAHHNDIEPITVLDFIVQAADAISAGRPGARRENLENYIKRLEQLEEITGSFPGVEKSYAIQAGREVRVMIKPEVVSEDEMVILAHDIAKRIEDEMEYPGQIKVNVIREVKAVEYAK
ncbi:MAG: ribonuclease Y [Ruminococcaceae bacterium]|jgi:ribonuclease Y|nr:ribonuclease Y [Oscillospiraceae bacterium]